MDNIKLKKCPKLLKAGRPLFCNLIVSHNCFFKCKMCVDWKTPSRDSGLSYEACQKFINELADFIDYKLNINIMGGEPLMLDWILPLCKHIHEKGFNPIMTTNAYLIDENKARDIVDCNVGVLAISMDGIKPETHDSIRGKEGSHSRALRAIDYLGKHKKASPHITILPLILECNLDELTDLVKWASQVDAIDSVSFLALLESGLIKQKQGWFKHPAYRALWPQDINKLQDAVDGIIDLKKQGYRIDNPYSQLQAFKEYYADPEKFLETTEYCTHDYIIDMDPNGQILLSGHNLSSIKEGIDIERLWFSEKADQIRDYIDKYGCDNSRSCVINFLCAFKEDGSQQLDHHGSLGMLYYEQGKYDLALTNYKKALAKNPDNPKLHIGVAISYLNLGDYRASLVAFKDAFRLDPGLEAKTKIPYHRAIQEAIEYYNSKTDL